MCVVVGFNIWNVHLNRQFFSGPMHHGKRQSKNAQLYEVCSSPFDIQMDIFISE